MKKNNFKTFLKTASLLVILSSSFSQAKQYSSDKINGFKLSICSDKECIKLNSDKATKSKLAEGYAFSKVEFSTTNQHSHRKTQFTSLDVYYDLEINKILFRDIKNMKFKEAIYDFDKSELIKL